MSDAWTDAPPAVAAVPLPYSISAMHVQSMHRGGYVFTPLRTTSRELPDLATRQIAELNALGGAGRLTSAGPPLFVLHDPSEDPDAPFDLDVGLPVNDATALPPGYSYRALPAFACATVLYRGPLSLRDKAYDRLIAEMIATGLTPSAETRESYLAWDDAASANNVILIEVGIR